jgi:superfamily II DNA or RNA helicase
VSDFPTDLWWDYDLTEENFSSGTTGRHHGRRQLLTHSEACRLIPNRYDYIDIGSEMRHEFMLPNSQEFALHPEPWQLQMLASLKERKSLVVIAPTSSGKTMSAEYAMRISAKTQGNGFGVFVLPTNALVRQTYATLCHDRNIPKGVVAMFTSERRDNFDSQQFKILVTNPQCLHLLIFSKTATAIFQRIECVVIDEVHCIGATTATSETESGGGSGPVIERLLCMLRCPVVCLSATLANATHFVSWLRSLRADQGGEGLVEVIEHQERSTALHFHSLGFAKDTEPAIEVEPQGTHEIGKYNLQIGLEIAVPCILSGQWILTLPVSAVPNQRPDRAVFDQVITPQVMSTSITLSDQIISFDVKVLSVYLNGVMAGVVVMEHKGNQKRGNPFPINFTLPDLVLSFQFEFDMQRNEIVFELTHSRTECRLLSSEFPLTGGDGDGDGSGGGGNLLNLTSTHFEFSAREKCYVVRSFRGYVKQPHRILRLTAALDPNAIPRIVQIDLNPLAFLPCLPNLSPEVVAGFLSACPSLQPHHIVETFDALKLQLGSVDQVPLLGSVAIGSSELLVPLALIETYQTLAADSYLPSDPHAYASFRSRYSLYVTRLHEIIVQQDSLLLRLVLDHMMANIFSRSSLDWYGKLFYLSSTRLVPIHHLESDLSWEDEIHHVHHTLLSPNLFVSSLCRSTSTLAFDSTLCLRNIFAMDTSMKYFLSLLLKTGTDSEEQTSVPSAVRAAVIHALDISNRSRMKQLHESTPRKKDRYGLHPNEIISIIHNFMEQEKIPPLPPSPCPPPPLPPSPCLPPPPLSPLSRSPPLPSGARRPTPPHEVQSPTILFHFSKKGITKMVSILLEKTSLWWGEGGRVYEPGHYLTQEDRNRISTFLPNQIRDYEKKALFYGIGLHYRVSRENQDYLEEVEYLFQSKKLKFVFATGSLSYGINMPAAHVVFLGDSPYLDGLMFRQCAGRAGRRGYGIDVGKVHFVGIDISSMIRKMCLPLDQLRPQLALSASYLLSCSILRATCQESDTEWIHALILRTLTQPLYQHLLLSASSSTRHLFDQALAHSCFFTWSFLNQRGYLQADGSPTLKCDLPHRLHYLEPQCFILAEMLTECIDPTLQIGKMTLLSLIDDELLGSSPNDSDRQSEVQKKRYRHLEDVIFSFLNHLLSLSGVSRKRKDTNTLVLDPIIKRVWNDYSSEVMQRFVGYLKGIGKDLTERCLPLGEEGETRQGWDYYPSHSTSQDRYHHLRRWLNQQREQSGQPSAPLARSVFAALSHPHDLFQSIHDMSLTIKEGLFVSDHIIPSRDYPNHVHIRLEEIYRRQSFKAVKEKYQDVDVETSCETFSKTIRCVRAFLQKLLAALGHQSRQGEEMGGGGGGGGDDGSDKGLVSEKAVILFEMIIFVITKFEVNLSVARGLGERLIGRVVEITGGAMRLDPLTGEAKSAGLMLSRDGNSSVDLGSLVSYYALMTLGRYSYQYPEKLESKIKWPTQRQGVIVSRCQGALGRGEVEDRVSQKIFVYYSFQLPRHAPVGCRVKFTTVYVTELGFEIVESIAALRR